jgi:hypothetical protein
MRTRVLIPLLCITSVVVSGSCRNQEPDIVFSGPTATTPELAKVEFVARANVACREAEKQIAARTDDHGPTQNDAGSRDAQGRLVEAIQPVARQAIEVLRNLTPPAADAALIRAGIDKMSAYLDRAVADPTISIDPIGLVDRALNDYGLTDCFSTG